MTSNTMTNNAMTMTALTAALALAIAPVFACAAQPLPVASLPVTASATKPAPPTPAPAPAARPASTPATTITPPPALETPDAPFRAQAPAPGPEPSFRVPPFKRFKLKTGLSVILAEVHDLPLIEIHLVVKTGGAANPNGEAGLADLTANMLDEGTKTRTALDIAEQIGDLGAALSSGASWDASTVTLSTIARSFDPALAIWADVIMHPAFTEKDLVRVRDNLVTGVARRKDSPPTVASLALARVLFGERNPYGWPQTGTEETLKKLTVGEVQRFYATYYHPGNATIIVAGDIGEAELKKKLEAALGGWRGGGAPQIKPPAAPPIDKKKIVLIDKPGAPQSSVRVGFVGVRRTDPDYFPIVLMNQIFGGSFYRLDMNLRERQQWTYGARSVIDMRKAPGPAAAGGEIVAAHTADAVAEILKEMRIMASTEVTDEELARAKDNFAKSFPARFATRGATAGLLAELAIYGLPDNFPATYTKNIDAVTKAEIRRVAQRLLRPDKVVIVVVGDRATQEIPLAKLAPVELRDLEGNPIPARPPEKAPAAGAGAAKPGGEAD